MPLALPENTTPMPQLAAAALKPRQVSNFATHKPAQWIEPISDNSLTMIITDNETNKKQKVVVSNSSRSIILYSCHGNALNIHEQNMPAGTTATLSVQVTHTSANLVTTEITDRQKKITKTYTENML